MTRWPTKDSPPANHEMVTLARESRGLTQKEAANRLGISQARLSKTEGGLASIDEELLGKLSKVFQYPPEFFSVKNAVFGPGISEFFHRKLQATPVRKLRKLHAEISIKIFNIQRLLRAVDIVADDIPRFDLEEDWSVKEAARAVRARWNLPPGPIQNVVKSIETAGGIVIPCKFECSVDAISRYIPGLPRLFFVDDSLPGDRLRMTLAHELGHAVMHQVPNPEMEDQAFQFAAEFLMPEREICTQFGDQVNLAKLGTMKQVWKVSMAALLKCAGDLGKITPRMQRHLWAQMSKAGYRTREPADFDIPKEEPQLLKQIIEIHQTDLGYGLSELSKLLVLLEDEARNTFNIDRTKAESKLRLRAV
ncbi:MAG: ImmA/IrrE family metallo-endopeptidase [Actinobacteria bacterium]|nr:ImmA/IrrE family metallo-endopeptidase [Actinomycetota bacterium]